MFRVRAAPRSQGRLGQSQSERSLRGRKVAANAGQPVRILDRILFVAYILVSVCSENGDPDDAGKSGINVPGSFWSLSYLIAFIAVLIERKTAFRLLRGSLPLVLVLLLICLSPLWSDAPSIATQRSFGLLGYTAIAFALVCRLGQRGFIETIALLITIEAALSVVLIAFLPALGRSGEGEWQGIFVHKNELAECMVLGMATIMCLETNERGVRRFQIIAIPILFVLLVGSKGISSLITAVTLAIIFALGLWCRAHYRKPALLAGAFVVLAAILGVLRTTIDTDQLLGALGKNATLSGRTQLWDAIFAAIEQRPVLGYGYGVFWSDDGPAATFMLHYGVLWDPGMAHNGFLEVAVNVGILGVAFLILLLIVGLTRAASAFWQSSNRLSAWPILVMLYVILSNFSAANLERAHNLLWIAYVAAFLIAADAHLGRKHLRSTESTPKGNTPKRLSVPAFLSHQR